MLQEMVMQQLNKLQDGESLGAAAVLIVDKRAAVAKNGKPYADLVVRDSGGTLKCKIWNFQDHDWIAAGKVVDISGEVSTYNGELQLTVSGITPNLKVKPESLAKCSRFPVEKMWDRILDYIDCTEEPLAKYIAKKLFMRFEPGLKKATAAVGMHNAWYGGLLEHTLSMCNIAEEVCNHYIARYGKGKFSYDKVIFGVLLHDIGKVLEYDYTNPAFKMSADGLLTPHLVMGPALIFEEANRWYDEEENIDMPLADFERERAILMHVVAAHHNKQEWGSPVVPATLEAILVHQIDVMDAAFMHALELVEGKEGPIPGFSERSYTNKTSYLQYNKEV